MNQENIPSNRILYGNQLRSWALNGEKPTQFHSDHYKQNSIDEFLFENFHLIGSQILFRHGARTPLKILPKLDEIEYPDEHLETYPPTKANIQLIMKYQNKFVETNQRKTIQLKSKTENRIVYCGQLTSIGEKQLFQLGYSLQSEFIENKSNSLPFLPSFYDRNLIYCRSTFIERTINSARAFLSGLFYSSSLNQSTSFSLTEKEKENPFEIEVQHIHDEDLFPNSRLNEILSKCLSSQILYEQLSDNNDLKQKRTKFIEYFDLNPCSDGLIELFDDIQSRKTHQYFIPNDLQEFVQTMSFDSAREFILKTASIDFNDYLRASCGSILYQLNSNFQMIHHNFNSNSTNRRFFIYSGHDSTLLPLLLTFQIFDMNWPDFSSFLLFKYYQSKTNPNETYLTMNYNGQLKINPFSNHFLCSYSTWFENIQDLIEKPKYFSSPLN